MVMALVAYVGVYHLPSAYYLFFFGVVELSSIPLAVVDFFHPQKGLPWLLDDSSLLRTVNEISRVLFALLFLVVRALCFPYVVGLRLLPDVMETWRKQLILANDVAPLGVIVVSSVGLTLLQLYWATLIVKQLLKLISGRGDENGKDKKKQKSN
jgi:hypothetical protein